MNDREKIKKFAEIGKGRIEVHCEKCGASFTLYDYRDSELCPSCREKEEIQIAINVESKYLSKAKVLPDYKGPVWFAEERYESVEEVIEAFTSRGLRPPEMCWASEWIPFNFDIEGVLSEYTDEFYGEERALRGMSDLLDAIKEFNLLQDGHEAEGEYAVLVKLR